MRHSTHAIAFLNDSGRLQQNRAGLKLVELLVVVAIIAIIIALFLPATRRARPAARRSQCKNYLKQIGLALYNYHDHYGSFPPPYTVDANGQPLHSWRTLLLPFIEQQALYDSIDLAKPWNDPVNAAAFETQLAIYQCPSLTIDPNATTYMVLVDAASLFPPGESRKLSDIKDKTGDTLLVIEVTEAQAIPWMQPSDADETLLQGLTHDVPLAHSGGFQVCFADGSARFLSGEMSRELRHALMTISGGEQLGEY